MTPDPIREEVVKLLANVGDDYAGTVNAIVTYIKELEQEAYDKGCKHGQTINQ